MTTEGSKIRREDKFILSLTKLGESSGFCQFHNYITQGETFAAPLLAKVTLVSPYPNLV